MKWLYALNAESKYPILRINDEIGKGIDGVQFSREVFELDKLSPTRITIYVNSIGGDVKQGYDIFEAICNCSTYIKVIITGFAYSTAGWCILGADEIEVRSYSSWMCHLPYIQSDPTKKSELLDTVANSVKTIISNRSGRNGFAKKSEEEVLDMMTKKTFLKGNDIYKSGLIDKVVNHEITVHSLKESELYEEFQSILNKEILQNTEAMPIPTSILNKLNLTEESSEQDILSAVVNLEGQIATHAAANIELQGKITTLESEKVANLQRISELNSKESELASSKVALANRQAELDVEKSAVASSATRIINLETEINELKNKQAEIESAGKETAVMNMLNPFVETGRIKDDEAVINAWKKRAMKSDEDFEDTKLILESMPVNMHLPTPKRTSETSETNDVEEGSAEYYRIQNNLRAEGKPNVLDGTLVG